jgi:penicillin-binding protein 2
MRSELNKKKHLSRRSFILGSIQVGIAATLTGRLFQLQSLRASEYATLAEDNRINLKLIRPERGIIYDRFGVPLAINNPNYQLMINRAALKEQPDILLKLAQYVEEDEASLKDMLNRQLRRTPHDQNIMLKEHLEWAEVSAIELNSSDLHGVSVEVGEIRRYPYDFATSHLLGYVGTASQNEAKDNRLLKVPGMKIGKNGLEQQAEARLQGKAGLRYMEVNAAGRYLKEVKRDEAIAGENLNATISAELQAFAAERIGQESGSAVIMDIHNGDVLTLCSVPSYDPNRFSRGITHTYWNELTADEKTPLVNKTINGQYPPGSTFKMLVGLKGLETGTITPETRFSCPGHYYLGRHRFNCWRPEGHGSVNYRQAVERSCDVFFYNVARRIGIEAISEMCHVLGLGEKYNLGLIGEKAGLIPTPEWKRGAHNDIWHPGDTINSSIGQGYVLTTPLQLAIMTARLATGKKVMPRLWTDTALTPFEPLNITPEHLLLAQQGMTDVTTTWQGTARASQIPVKGFEMAGKTGTSQVRRITVRGQDQNRIPWKQRHHGLFVAYAPIVNPRFAGAVVIEHGGGGSSAAAPVMKDIMLKCQEIMAEKEKPKEVS